MTARPAEIGAEAGPADSAAVIARGLGVSPTGFAEASDRTTFALWSKVVDQPLEVQGRAEPGLHVIGFPLRTYRCEVRKDGAPVFAGELRRGTCQIMEAGVTPYAVFVSPVRMLHVYLSCERLRLLSTDDDGDTMELLDPVRKGPLRDFDGWAVAVAGRLGHASERPSRLWFDGATLQLVSLLQLHAAAKPLPFVSKGGLSPALLRRVEDFTRAHLDQEIDLASLAAVTGLSAKHFARAFKQTTATPPHRWLTQLRVECAMDMLGRSEAPLAEIALACGFADQSHFTATFRRMVGVTPGRYRQERRG